MGGHRWHAKPVGRLQSLSKIITNHYQAVNFLNAMAFKIGLSSLETPTVNGSSDIKPRAKVPTFDPVRHKLHLVE